MSNILATAAIGAGLAAGGQAGSINRQAERADARSRKEASDQKLEKLRATKPTEKDLSNMSDVQSLEIENLKAGQQQTLRKNNERTTYSAFERYDSSGEIRHLNSMLGDLKSSGSPLYQDTVRFDTLTEADAELMDKSGGFSNDMALNDPAVKGSIVKATKADGSTELVNLDTLKATTNYNTYASTQELERQKAAQEVKIMDSLGYADLTEPSRDAFRRAVNEVGSPQAAGFQEAYSKYLDANKVLSRRGGIRPENKTEREAEAVRRVGMEGIRPGDPGYDAAFSSAMTDINKEWGRPSAVRKAEDATDAEANLDEMGFWEKDLTTISGKDRAPIEREIRRIEEVGGQSLSAKDETQLTRIRELTSLGDAASELTSEQTGVIDNVLRTAKKYIFNDVDGIDSEAAYAAYRNTVKHALYGASLQPGESTNFVEQFGSLAQQQGPVLAQLRSSLTQLRSNYQSISDLNNPYVVAYRTGKTGAELEDVMNALDDRIEMIDNIAQNKPVTVLNPKIKQPDGSTTQITPQNRSTLDRLSGKQPLNMNPGDVRVGGPQ